MYQTYLERKLNYLEVKRHQQSPHSCGKDDANHPEPSAKKTYCKEMQTIKHLQGMLSTQHFPAHLNEKEYGYKIDKYDQKIKELTGGGGKTQKTGKKAKITNE